MSTGSSVVGALRGRLVVSCQAAPGDPMRQASVIAAVAASVVAAGAAGVRIDTPEHVQAVRSACDTTIIGLYKSGEAEVYITPTFEHARSLVEAGADIVALDATGRARPDGSSLAEMISRLHEELGAVVMADVSTVEEGLRAAVLGADVVATTLFGETGDGHGFGPTGPGEPDGPELDGLATLASSLDIPVFAEGRVSSPEHALAAFERGAWAVVVGRAITSPSWIVARFLAKLERAPGSRPAAGAVER